MFYHARGWFFRPVAVGDAAVVGRRFLLVGLRGIGGVAVLLSRHVDLPATAVLTLVVRLAAALKRLREDGRHLLVASTPTFAAIFKSIQINVLEEFLKPLEMTQAAAAKSLGMSTVRLNELVRGKRGVTADTALRLAEFFKTSPQFWMHLQAGFDLKAAIVRRRALKLAKRT